MNEDYMNNIGVDEYGYPTISFLGGKGKWIRITQGWFFPDVHPDEPAWYIEHYFNKNGDYELILNGIWILFDFWTSLKDYTMGYISGTIAQNFQIPEHIQMNEITVRGNFE